MAESLYFMENTKNNTKSTSSTDNKFFLNKNMFEFKYIIGKGGFGKVWKVLYKKNKEYYALKEMSKNKIIDKKSEKSINNERVFLSKLRHPFIINMHFAFQDNDNLYLVIDILNGGDLRYHCSRYRKFSEEQTRFFIACIVHTLSYIHMNNVIHRDIKPENLILDDKGYVHITDFGIAKENCDDNSSETSGTPGYMAPEVIRGVGHSFSVDYFAIGIIGYEFMMGKRPYNGKNRKEIKEQMLNRQAKIKRNEIVKGWSKESRDFINQLIKRKPELRLGSKEGIKELKEHFWLRYYPWKELENKILPAPFIPEKKDNFDRNYCEGIDKINESTRIRFEQIAKSHHYKSAFANFYFNKEENINNIKTKINSNNNIYNSLSSSKKDLIDTFPKKINYYISSKKFDNPAKSKNICLKKSEMMNEEKNNIKNINDHLYKKMTQRPFTSKSKTRKEKLKKSLSQQLYEIKSIDNSLYALLNSNYGIFSVRNKRIDKKNKFNQIINKKDKDNCSFSSIGLIKKDIKFNNNIIKKIIKDYYSAQKQIKEDVSKIKKSFSYLNDNNFTKNNIVNINHRNNSSLIVFKKIRNKILFNQFNIKNKNNIEAYNKKEMFKKHKRNNSFFLKKNNRKLDLSSIRLYEQKNNNIINNQKNILKINIHYIKGSKTSRKENNNNLENFFNNNELKRNEFYKNIKEIKKSK